MKQYCRYCNNLVTGNGTYCTAKNKEMRDSTAKSANHCKEFEFNEMDAFLKLTDINREIQSKQNRKEQFLNN